MRVLRNSALVFAVSAAAFALAGPALARRRDHLRHQLGGGGRARRLLPGCRRRHLREIRPEGQRSSPKADQAMLLGGKIQFYMQGNLLGTFSAVEQDVPVIEVAAMFQKDPQIIMAHPEAGLKKFGDLAKLKSLFIGDDLYVTGFQWMKAAYPGITDEQRKPYNYNLAPLPRRQGIRPAGLPDLRALRGQEGGRLRADGLPDGRRRLHHLLHHDRRHGRLRGRQPRRHQALRRGLDHRLVQLPLRRQQGRQRLDQERQPGHDRRADRLHDHADEGIRPARLRRGAKQGHRLHDRRG